MLLMLLPLAPAACSSYPCNFSSPALIPLLQPNPCLILLLIPASKSASVFVVAAAAASLAAAAPSSVPPPHFTHGVVPAPAAAAAPFCSCCCPCCPLLLLPLPVASSVASFTWLIPASYPGRFMWPSRLFDERACCQPVVTDVYGQPTTGDRNMSRSEQENSILKHPRLATVFVNSVHHWELNNSGNFLQFNQRVKTHVSHYKRLCYIIYACVTLQTPVSHNKRLSHILNICVTL